MKTINILKVEEKVYFEKLDNGLEVYMYPKNNIHNNYVTLTSHFGSINNEFIPYNKNKMVRIPNGVAHFLEHKLFAQEKGIDTYNLTISDIENIVKNLYKKQYNSMIKASIEDARAVLPNACETKIVFTMNARALMNFFKHRHCKRAQDEIRELATVMLEQVREVAPTLFRYSGAACQTGKCPEGDMSCRNPYPRLDIIK